MKMTNAEKPETPPGHGDKIFSTTVPIRPIDAGQQLIRQRILEITKPRQRIVSEEMEEDDDESDTDSVRNHEEETVKMKEEEEEEEEEDATSVADPPPSTTSSSSSSSRPPPHLVLNILHYLYHKCVQKGKKQKRL
jgi:hypothetical protein